MIIHIIGSSILVVLAVAIYRQHRASRKAEADAAALLKKRTGR